MFRKAILALVLALGLVLAVAAQTPDFLKAGGWELGGNCMFIYRPSYALFAGDLTEAQKASYSTTLDAGLKAGIFLRDRFSLALRGSAFMRSSHSGVSPTESKEAELSLGLGLEPTYYLMLGDSFALGLGGEAGIYANPGIDEISSGTKVNNDSLALSLQVEPKVAAYYFLSGGLAAYAQIGWKFFYFRNVKNADGSAHVYASGYSMFDDLYGHLGCSIGITYFLPPGGRAVETHKTSLDDYIENIGI